VHLRRTDSTNSRARELAIAGAPHGTLVSADEQSAGRGRQGRHWFAEPHSSLLCSLLLREPPELLPLIAGVAVCQAVGGKALVKWPNDIVLEGSDPAHPLAKLAGILVEGRPQEGWAVVGIGLNVAVRRDQLPDELRHSAASMELPPEEIEPTLGRVLEALERVLGEPAARVLEAWRERDALSGREISWQHGKGRAQGIDGTGRLIVKRSDGARVTLDAGEVHLGYSPT
jgi:BirA family biotin operon repressor/biotin-[acetyl-CoA-carboxylase] ligase